MVAHFKKPKKRIRFSNIFPYIVLVILVVAITWFLIISNFKINQKRRDLKAQINQLEKEIQFYEERNERLKAGISEGGTQDYLESKIREQLNQRKHGEEVVVVLPPKENQEENAPKEKNLWEKFLDIFNLRD